MYISIYLSISISIYIYLSIYLSIYRNYKYTGSCYSAITRPLVHFAYHPPQILFPEVLILSKTFLIMFIATSCYSWTLAEYL